MRLICYPTSGDPPKIVPAPVERAWMERTEQGFAYRCLPLNIANAHGWLLLNTIPFVAQWDGGSGLGAISLHAVTADRPLLALSHFGNGVLTFNVNALFRTEPGYDLMATGPLNQPKDGLQPLTGIIETDWAPFTFTMNWKFTRKLTPVAFERDEAYCMIFPLKRGLVEEVKPEIRDLESDKEVSDAYRRWTDSRRQFNAGLQQPGSEAQALKWQKDYFRGRAPFGTAPPDHRTRLRLAGFRWAPRSDRRD
jgi:Family of unknown function (DUF6065)